MKEIISAVSTLIVFPPSSVSEETKEVFGGDQSLNVSYMKFSCSVNARKKGAVRTPGAEWGVLSWSAPSWLSYLCMEQMFGQLTGLLTGKTLN